MIFFFYDVDISKECLGLDRESAELLSLLYVPN